MIMAYQHPGSGYSEEDERESRSGDDFTDTDWKDKPNYLLEHLATFTVSKESGIVYPADGMRRLLQLEKTTGIWSQKMQMCLDRKWVLIMDYETRNIIERFPASLIQEPTAFTSNSPMDMYNNVLVFVVGDGSRTRSEMHIFQCQNMSAISIVDDLKQLRSGKAVTQTRNHSILQKSPPIAAVAPISVAQELYHHQYGTSGGQETDSEIGGINDDVSSTSSEKYERDVMVLNHCFDDIEKFIARLQHAAAASRELERRRHNRKSKKRDPGEGLLSLRTKPPHEAEFIDIFAKFKLSFNLLAKLKAHIHDPNAPELVHFLFTPLALIVDASHDTYYDPNLPARVINPLLTREAINLLINCVTSKETELWRSLGEAWTLPRDQWKGHTGHYHPVFFDGWSPEYPIDDSVAIDGGTESISTPLIKRRIEIAAQYTATDYEYDPKYNPPGSPGLRDFSTRSDISADSMDRSGLGAGRLMIDNARNQAAQTVAAMSNRMASMPKVIPTANANIDAWLEDVQTKGGRIVEVTYPRTANNDKELTVVRGEFLEILDDTRKWWKARNSRGQVAHVPHTIVTPVNYETTIMYTASSSQMLQSK